MRIVRLAIADHILEKIETKHNVSFDEVEEVCFNQRQRLDLRGREGLYRILGRTYGGRYRMVVLAALGAGRFRVVTARNQTPQERRRYAQLRRGRVMLTDEQERELARLDAGGDAFAGAEPLETPLDVRQPLDKTVAIRLTDEQWKALRAEARAVGLGPTGLAHTWLLEKLRQAGRLRPTA